MITHWRCEKCDHDGQVVHAPQEDAQSVINRIEESHRMSHRGLRRRCQFDFYAVRVFLSEGAARPDHTGG